MLRAEWVDKALGVDMAFVEPYIVRNSYNDMMQARDAGRVYGSENEAALLVEVAECLLTDVRNEERLAKIAEALKHYLPYAKTLKVEIYVSTK